MLEILKPILVSFVTSKPVKELLIKILRSIAAVSETKLDDAAVDFVEERLLG